MVIPVVLGAVVGIVSGLMAVFYRILLGKIDQIRTSLYAEGFSIGMLLLALFAAWAIIKLLWWARFSGGSGIPQIRGELLGQWEMPIASTMASKIAGGALGNLVGLSLGREGPSIQLGGLTGKVVAKITGRSVESERILIAAGSSAGLAAAFNAPIAGTLFALEELYGTFSHRLFIPGMTASLTATGVSYFLLGDNASFTFRISEVLGLHTAFWVILTGVLAGLSGICFNRLLEHVRGIFGKVPGGLRSILPFVLLLTVAIGYLFPEILGGGHHLVEMLVTTDISLALCLLLLVSKLLFTVFCYDSGAQGGIFLPVLVLGALCGSIVFYLSGMDPVYKVNFIICGMAAVMTSVVRSPIMAILLVMEMTGSFTHLTMIALSAMTAFLVAEGTGTEAVYETLYENMVHRFCPEKKHEKRETVVYPMRISQDFPYLERHLKDIPFPEGIKVGEIIREGRPIIPAGNDILKAQDEVYLLGFSGDGDRIYRFFNDSTEMKS